MKLSLTFFVTIFPLSMHPMSLLDYFKNNGAKIECLNNIERLNRDILKEIFKMLVVPKTNQAHHIRTAAKNFNNIALTCKPWRTMLDEIIIRIEKQGKKEEISIKSQLIFLMNRVREVNQSFPEDNNLLSAKWLRTPLTYQIRYCRCLPNNSYFIVENMLNDCHDVNQRDKCDKTPLYYAIEMGSSEMVQLLLDYDADVYNIDTAPCSTTKNGNALDIALFVNCYDRGSKAGIIRAKYPELDPNHPGYKYWCTIQ